MRKIKVGVVLIALVSSILLIGVVLWDNDSESNFKITSPAFKQGEYIPDRYTCRGLDINPEFHINGTPNNALSLVLIMDDPDAKEVAGFTWVHWIVWNISPSTIIIEENSVPDNAMQGMNSRSTVDYQGPCPPSPRDHRYYFKLYAVDIELDLPSSSGITLLEEAMDGHIIEKAQLMGRYTQP
ncbi:MAG: YbhB/YbcL family Raf kinase inhibitor-like protein [Candidatus Kariarchaeaceae archaeon]|jgi:Raf kinase inhibitor-like YbhB/YbcL family protein